MSTLPGLISRWTTPSRWAAPTPATALNSIFGAGTGANLTVWAVGDGGQALKYNPANKTWSATAVGPLTDSYREVAPKAMSFHATRVSPNWTDRRMVSRIGNHIFYR